MSESKFITSELTFPLPGASQPEDIFSFVLLSAEDVSKPDIDTRLDRLLCGQGGKNLAVVFLTATLRGMNGSVALQELQFRYAPFSSPTPYLNHLGTSNHPGTEAKPD